MNWNTVAVIHEGGFIQALRALREFGFVRRSRFYNVLEMNVANIRELLENLRRKLTEDPGSLAFLSRILPVAMTFAFSSREEFEKKARESVLVFIPELKGKTFHVRIHRRGFERIFKSPEEERFLNRLLLEELEKTGSPGAVSYEDPDEIVSIETIEDRAGVALWGREDLALYPFLRVE